MSAADGEADDSSGPDYAALLDRLFEASTVGMQINSPSGHYVRVNRAFADFVGYEPEELIGRGWWEISFEEEVSRSDAIRARLWSRDDSAYRQVKRYLTKDGRTVWGALTVLPVFESVDHDEPQQILATVVDVTGEMEATAELSAAKRALLASEQRFLALVSSIAATGASAIPSEELDDPTGVTGRRLPSSLTDAATGVANRAVIHDRLQHALDCVGRVSHGGVAAAILEITDLTTLAVGFGGDFFDDALRRLALEAVALLRPVDSIGRLDDQQFLVVMEGVESAEAARSIITRFVDAISPIAMAGRVAPAVELEVSAGVAWTDAPTSAGSLVARADRALVEHRAAARAVHHVGADRGDTVSIREAHLQSHRIGLREISSAVDRDEFVVHYQSIHDAERRIVAVEALLRWEHPQRGLLVPGDFLDLLMHSGHIGTVGARVLETAAADLVEWDASGAAGLQMHVNVSPAELAHPDFERALHSAIERHPFDPHRLVVEVTETSLDGSLVSTAVLNDIVRSGARLVLDDFGTGVSSLQHLRTEPLHGIKVDRSFVSGSRPGGLDRRIVEGLVGLARHLGIEVTAEGVETEEEADWIVSTGCEQMQGWLFSRAVPAPTLRDLVVAAR